MSISIKELTGQDCWRYLAETVTNDAATLPDAVSSMTAYYEAAGTPPGHWMGSGLAGLGHGQIVAGQEISAEAMEAVLGHLTDPVTGQRLGLDPGDPLPYRERVQRRIWDLPPTLEGDERTAAITRIKAEEKARKHKRSVHGFDLTFEMPKSVSVLWALGDEGIREQVESAHREALADVLATIERDVARTRIGSQGVAEVQTRGLIAAAYEHFDSRAHDPHLHTHLVIANRVQGQDGKWRTLHSRVLFKATVSMGELYNTVLADKLTARLGVHWEPKNATTAPKRKNVIWEVRGITRELITAFSARHDIITAKKKELVAESTARTGTPPSPAEDRLLDRRAWQRTRPEKTVYSLRTLRATWAKRAHQLMRPGQLDRTLRSVVHPQNETAWVRAADLTGPRLDGLVEDVFARLHESRSTWTVWNVRAEAARATMHLRFPTMTDREEALSRIATQVEARSVALRVPDLAFVPERWRTPEGSAFRGDDGRLFTSTTLLAAEARLQAAAGTATAPGVDPDRAFDTLTSYRSEAGFALAADQAAAIFDIATSHRAVDVLVGPAGAGKTTALAGLRATWEAQHGAGTIIGLAPSAQAAHVLGDELGLAADNTAKWLTEYHRAPAKQGGIAALRALRRRLVALPADDALAAEQVRAAAATIIRAAAAGPHGPATVRWLIARLGGPHTDQDGHTVDRPLGSTLATRTRRGDNPTRTLDRLIDQAEADLAAWRVRPGQLLIVDEASLAGTLAIDELAGQAQAAGAKLLLVGDPGQLAAVDAGGAFGLLVRDRHATGGAPELTGVRRFHEDWERAASLRLRRGETAVLDTYTGHDRIHDGTTDQMVDAAYRAWAADRSRGLESLLIAGDNTTVRTLNARAQADRITAGQVTTQSGPALHDGLTAHAGDRIITRQNNRRLMAGSSWVKNGDTFDVVATGHDGTLTVRRSTGGGIVTLPADYVAANVELAYAVTAHRAQGATVDTAHVIVNGPTLTREVFYVGMTRGRQANHAWVATDTPDQYDEAHSPDDDPDAREILTAVLTRSGAALSATETRDELRDRATSVAQLAAEYDTIARDARTTRALALLEHAGLGPQEVDAFQDHQAWPQLSRALHLAEERGLLGVLPTLLAAPADPDVDRVHAATQAIRATAAAVGPATPARDALIAGLIPAARPTDPDTRRALEERARLIEARAADLVDTALTAPGSWITSLGQPPTRPIAWRAAAITIAAYRDRWQVDTDTPLGAKPGRNWAQLADWRRARQALTEARRLAGVRPVTPRPRRSPAPVAPQPQAQRDPTPRR